MFRLVVDRGETSASIETDEEQGKEEVMEVVISHEVDRRLIEKFGEQTISRTNDQGTILHLFPLHIIEFIAEQCLVATDYLNFRATCKRCRLAAPPIQWSTETALNRLQKHSLVSPWLVVLDEDQGVTTFTDPKSGDKYYKKTIPNLIGDVIVCASGHGWLLLFGAAFRRLVFFNPLTNKTIALPLLEQHFLCFSSFVFSEPPTSPLFVIAGFAFRRGRTTVLTLSQKNPEWHAINIDCGIRLNQISYNSRTFFGGNIYILCEHGELGIVKCDQDFSWEILVDEPPESFSLDWMQHFLLQCGDDLLLISVCKYGELVEIFRLNHSLRQWEQIHDIGKNMIFVCNKACFSVPSKISGMENKIYFPKFHSGKVVFYSLDTCKLHTCKRNDEDEEKELIDFFSTKEHMTSVWIDPSWSDNFMFCN